MALNQPQAADPMEPFFLGTQTGGGYWTDISRLSSHDHSGGLMGAPVAVNIPDGSITAADLDPSVLAPYALTDGSKPFTGQVTMQADAVVRDAINFGPQGSAAPTDAAIGRAGPNDLRTGEFGVGLLRALPLAVGTGAEVRIHDRASGLGANYGAWYRDNAVINLYDSAKNRLIARWDGGATLILNPDAGANALQALAGVEVIADTGVGPALVLRPTDDTNAAQFVLGQTNAAGTAWKWQFTKAGTLWLTPDAGQAGVVVERIISPAAKHLTLAPSASAFLYADPPGNLFLPTRDNAIFFGNGTQRWAALYAVNGSIQTSSADLKRDITPLDPAAALAAVLATDPVVFDYQPPERGAEWYELPDDPEQAEAVLHQRLTSAPLEAAARHQAGFVLSSPDYATDPLFETGEGQSNAANSVGVLLAAIHALSSRLAALEGAN
jgi:hypothetical protein